MTQRSRLASLITTSLTILMSSISSIPTCPKPPSVLIDAFSASADSPSSSAVSSFGLSFDNDRVWRLTGFFDLHTNSTSSNNTDYPMNTLLTISSSPSSYISFGIHFDTLSMDWHVSYYTRHNTLLSGLMTMYTTSLAVEPSAGFVQTCRVYSHRRID